MLLHRTKHCTSSASLTNGKNCFAVLFLLGLFVLVGNRSLMKFSDTFKILHHPASLVRVNNWSISYTNTLIKSEWITKFPELEAMVKYIVSKPQFPLFYATTDPTTTRLVAQYNNLIVGNKWKALIYAKDFDNNSKSYGGDYFSVVLHRTAVRGDGVCCDVIDNLDGTYSVTCELPWQGQAKVEVILIHPSESVFYLMTNTSSRKSGVGYTTTFMNSKGEKETSNCALSFDGNNRYVISNYILQTVTYYHFQAMDPN